MSYLDRLKAAKRPNVPSEAPTETAESGNGHSNALTLTTAETDESIDVTPYGSFGSDPSEHIPGTLPAMADRVQGGASIGADADPTPVSAPLGPPVPAADRGADRLPPEWVPAFDAISLSPVPGDYDAARWTDALAGMEAFCAQWAGRARALGWQGEELFSLHPTAPAARHDKRGLALSLGGGARVESLDDRGADIRTTGGARQRFYRRPGQ